MVINNKILLGGIIAILVVMVLLYFARANKTESFDNLPANSYVVFANQSGTLSNFDIASLLDMAIPKGTIVAWNGDFSSVPAGWAVCDGNKGTPDLRGRFIYGKSDALTLKAIGGEEAHTLIESEIPPHRHTFRSNPTCGCGGGGCLCSLNAENDFRVDTITPPSYPTGGGQPHNNLPPFMVLFYIMKI